jgi:asparagine synthase (glutamine-hydrolysing)
MCGFAGYIDGKWEHNDAHAYDQLSIMSKKIEHRGPDSSGHWIDRKNSVALTHRRLSILDLSDAGSQPFISKSGRYVIIYNGEIYNHLALRKELQAGSPIDWSSNSDTETLILCIERYGLQKTLEKISGMFSFALWDREHLTLSLARDRIGEKPLYYGWQNDTFLFGSDLASLKAHSKFESKIDHNSLNLFLRYNFIPSPFSIYKGIYKVQPGTFVRLSKKNGSFQSNISPQKIKYWSLDDVIKFNLDQNIDYDEEEVIEKLDLVLRKAIKRQMISDVPIGAFLSGGIDSSLIASIMQSESVNPINTFTIGFNESSYNEASQANKIAQQIGSNHHELYVTQNDALSVVPDMQKIYSEPFADSSQIPTYLVSKLAKKYVTVSLSGDGGDELFGGYNRYQYSDKYWPTINTAPLFIKKYVSFLIKQIKPNKTRESSYNFLEYVLSKAPLSLPLEKLQKIGSILLQRNPDEVYLSLTSICSNPSRFLLESQEDYLTSIDTDLRFQTISQKMMYLDTLSYLPDDILVKIDRAAMAVSLETRVPFLDPKVIEYAWRTPQKYKIKNGQGKWMLKQLLNRYIPEQLFDRPKMGFGVPINDWLNGSLKDWSNDLLNVNRLNQDGFFNTSEVRGLLEQHWSGQKNNQHQLWGLLMFQSWLSENK